MLTVSHLRKVYSTVVAVDDISLEARQGEIFGLLGPNGAGKTTTIRMMLNIITPDSGEVRYDGKPFSAETRNMIGFLPEERGLYRKSSLLNTILYLAELRGVDRIEGKKRATDWLKRFDLLSHKDRKVEELSKGNQQKVQFITSVLHDPALVVLDEPFSGLDPVNQILLKDILMEMRQQGKTIIFSTHMMEQAEKLCERIALIDKGRVVLGGPLQEVKNRFGKQSVQIEFSGDARFLESLPTIRRAIVYENSAELELNADVPLDELLKVCASRLSLTSFHVEKPSLNAIFLDSVGGNSSKMAVAT